MRTGPVLSTERLRELVSYDPETGVFRRRTGRPIGKPAGYIASKGYRYIGVDRRIYRAARLAWLYMTGEWPPEQIDHINNVRDDDRFANLRKATPSQNSANGLRYSTNTSGFKGVSQSRRDALRPRPWRAEIRFKGKGYHLGFFATPEAAHAAYCDAARRFFGEFGNSGAR